MKTIIAFLLSLIIVAFGQPVFSNTISIIAAIGGFVPLFYILRNQSAKRRFWYGTLFFTYVQLIQLYWLTSHPYSYIYIVWALLSFLMGLQFGLITYFATAARLQRLSGPFFLASLWTLLEWSRLFFLTGFIFNPIGLSLAASSWALQTASLFGIYGLSFLVMLMNGFVTRFVIEKSFKAIAATLLIIAAPFLFGALRLSTKNVTHSPAFNAIIIQTKIMPEELETNGAKKNLVEEGLQTWKEIVEALEPFKSRAPFDLILLPEIVVPYDGQAPIYLLERVSAFIHSPLSPLGFSTENIAYVSSWAISSAIADEFKTPLLVGLEGSEISPQLRRKVYFNSAFFIRPANRVEKHKVEERYDKSILLPMAEEIPADWLKPLAAQYGLADSFQKGKGVVLFSSQNNTIATSVCYEDTFQSLLRDATFQGAHILTNVTNDGWYPNSLLGDEHFELARLRAVENGRPLIRSCNFGVSGAFDAYGNVVRSVNSDTMQKSVEAFEVNVPATALSTPFTSWGNAPLLLFCLFVVALWHNSTNKRD